MDEPDHPLPPSFEPFSLRVVSCARCRQPEVLLAQGQQDDDPAILALGRLAPQLRVPAYALLLPALGDRARVRKVFPGGGVCVDGPAVGPRAQHAPQQTCLPRATAVIGSTCERCWDVGQC